MRRGTRGRRFRARRATQVRGAGRGAGHGQPSPGGGSGVGGGPAGVVRLRALKSQAALVWLYAFGASPLWLLWSEPSSVHPLPQGEPVSVYTLTLPPRAK